MISHAFIHMQLVAHAKKIPVIYYQIKLLVTCAQEEHGLVYMYKKCDPFQKDSFMVLDYP